MKDRKVEIWDSLPSRRKNDQSRVTQVRRLVRVILQFVANDLYIYIYIYICSQKHLHYLFVNSLCGIEPLIVFQMSSLDNMLEMEIHSVFGSSFSFASFSIESDRKSVV